MAVYDDPASLFPQVHSAEVGVASPAGGALFEHFAMQVSHPGSSQVNTLAFRLIAMPAI